MSFKRIKIIRRKRKYTSRKNTIALKTFALYSAIWFLWLVLLFSMYIYFVYIHTLPSIKKLEQIDIPEASVIYDREWNQLYTLFWEEKRTYVNYDKISPNMVNAIVSWEDKTFFENPWIDFKWLLRAVFNFALHKTTKIEWTSTISQQLIRNVFLTNERSLERKVKEMYLSYQMTVNYSKEKILELYLNKISFWSNAFWVEQASLTFFGKHAKDLWVLEWSILASIPKWPTYYSPYNYYDRLVWYTYVYPNSDSWNTLKLIKKSEINENKELVSQYESFISSLEWRRIWTNGIILCNLSKDKFKTDISIDSDWCSLMNYSDLLSFLNSIKITSWDNSLEYQTWRKDFILWRMLEDDKISFDDYKKALLSAVWFEFKPYAENIKYPHFVFYVKEYLENKYWSEILEKEWLKIYTTIDPNLQNKAEELVKNQAASNLSKFDADNAALVSIDNASWDILAMVWSADYFDTEIDWNVNVVTSKRQPWSSFKPLVYALAIDKNQIWPHTPIYDLPMTFPWNYEPQNYNWKFSWKMSIMTALNHSRNIPAIQAYFLAWEQKEIINFTKNLWIKSLNENFYYWAPLALWTWEVKPLEMVQAYSVFANMWNKVEINPILKIYDSKWLLIEEKKKTYWTRVMDEKVAYIMNYILSATYSRPDEYWNTNLSLVDRQAWAKTWTSNKTYVVNWKKQLFPWDLWTVWYTPQITTVVWAWNTSWKAIKTNWDGLNWAAPIWKQFMEYAHKWKEKVTWKKPDNLQYVNISTISWLLAPEWFDKNFVVSSLFKNVPTSYDNSLKPIEVDAMCNWKVTSSTPPWAIKRWYYVALHSIDPSNPTWEAAVQNWVSEWWAEKLFWDIPNIITNYKDEECQRNENLVNSADIQISSNISEWETFINWYNYIEVTYKSANPLRSIQVLLWDNLIQEINIENQKSWTYKWSINIPSWYYWANSITIRAVDTVYMSSEEAKNIKIVQKDTIAPQVIFTNPENWKIWIYNDQFFNLRWYITERSNIKTINIYVDDKPYIMWLTWREFVQEINRATPIDVWTHKLKVEAVDFYFNKWIWEVDLEVMAR